MNDHELDHLVARAAPVDDGWVGTLDLRDAESELMEEIVSTPRTSVPEGTTDTPSPGTPEPQAESTPEEVTPFRGAHQRRHRVRAAVGVAAAVVIATLAVGGLLRHNAGDDARSVHVWAAAGAAVAPAILDPDVDGYDVTMTSGGDGAPQPVTPDGVPDTRVYGDVSDAGVANDVVIRVAPQAPEGTVLSEPVTVRGTQGTRCSPGPTQCDFGNNVTGVSWTEPSGGPYVTVESRTYDADQVLAIAEGVVVDSDSATLGSMPAGVAAPPLVAELDDDWAWEYLAMYQAPDGDSVSVATRAQTEPMRVYDLWRSGPRDGGEVNGHAASVEDIDGSFVVTWEPAAGQLVEVLTNGMDEAAALDAAGSVRPANPEEWADLRMHAGDALRDEMPGSGVEQPPEGAAHRLLTDEVTDVWGWLGAEGGPCYKVKESGNESRLCTSDPDTTVVGISPSSENDGPMETTPAAVGLAPEGTASIDGAEVTFGPDELGGRPFVCEFTDGEMHETVTFRDAGGAELGTAEVSVT